MKAIYLNKKAQSLTEMSVFGGVLLLVLSYFVSQGIRMMYQQDVQMRAFRMALSQAATQALRPDASATVILAEDKRVADPRDIAGKGEFVTVAGQGNIIWGNSLQKPIASGASEDLPRMIYKINDFEKSYLTAGAIEVSDATLPSLWIQLPGSNVRAEISWTDLRCFKPTDSSPKQARVLIPATLETEIISEFAETETGPMYRIINVPEDLNDGDPITRLEILLPEEGTINPSYTNLDYVKEQALKSGMAAGSEDKLQGLLPTSLLHVERNNSLKLEETTGSPGYHKSTTGFDSSGTVITHYIRKNGYGMDVVPYSPPGEGEKGTWIWQTNKPE